MPGDGELKMRSTSRYVSRYSVSKVQHFDNINIRFLYTSWCEHNLLRGFYFLLAYRDGDSSWLALSEGKHNLYIFVYKTTPFIIVVAHVGVVVIVAIVCVLYDIQHC